MSEKTMNRVYNITMGNKTTKVEARNGHYANVLGLAACGFKVGQLKRGRGQKAQVDETGHRTYAIKSTRKKAGFTVKAVDSFDAAREALVTIGATMKAANQRGRPVGSKNKATTAPATDLRLEGANPVITAEPVVQA